MAKRRKIPRFFFRHKNPMDNQDQLKTTEEEHVEDQEAVEAGSPAVTDEQFVEGEQEVAEESAKKEDRSAFNCPDCAGEGLKNETTLCPTCGGTGKV